MTSLKTVLLGSAAGLLAVGVAQAADLPVKKAAAAVQYVEVCPVYGSGFYKLPGTDICIRHFGSMKFNFAFQDERTAWFGPGDTAVSGRWFEHCRLAVDDSSGLGFPQPDRIRHPAHCRADARRSTQRRPPRRRCRA